MHKPWQAFPATPVRTRCKARGEVPPLTPSPSSFFLNFPPFAIRPPHFWPIFLLHQRVYSENLDITNCLPRKHLASDGLTERVMANPSPLRRGSSTGHLPLPPQPLATTSSTPTPSTAATTKNSSSEPPVHPSLLQPRVAVVLNVPPPWHPWLFTLRLVSILPALWWGLPSALQLLIRILPGPELVVVVPSATAGTKGLSVEADARYALTETGLATIWVRLYRGKLALLECKAVR